MKSWLVPVTKLHSNDRTAMYALLESHFQGITRDGFQADIDRKNWVLLLKDETSNALKGFSTLMLCHANFLGEKISVIYSGDTIVDRSAWSSTALPRTWIAAVNLLRQQYPENKLYWLLICSGFRTYRFLPIFWKEFYPRYNKDTPVPIENLMASLAREYYGDFYDKKSGIVRFKSPQILRDGLIEIPKGRETNPHIQFFTSKTPGYRCGDELVCFTEICSENLTQAGKRMWDAETPLELVKDSVVI